MLYSSRGKDFSHHVHPSLRRRIRIFLLLSLVMFIIAISDVVRGVLSIEVALLAIIVGGIVGFITTRIFRLSWAKDGNHVVANIDRIGFIVLVLYVGFEILRAYIFQSVIHVSSSATAITYMFIASALISRVVGLRGRVIRILKENDVFGPIV